VMSGDDHVPISLGIDLQYLVEVSFDQRS